MLVRVDVLVSERGREWLREAERGRERQRETERGVMGGQVSSAATAATFGVTRQPTWCSAGLTVGDKTAAVDRNLPCQLHIGHVSYRSVMLVTYFAMCVTDRRCLSQ